MDRPPTGTDLPLDHPRCDRRPDPRGSQLRSAPISVDKWVTPGVIRNAAASGRRRRRRRPVLGAGLPRLAEPERRNLLITVSDEHKGLPKAITPIRDRTVMQLVHRAPDPQELPLRQPQHRDGIVKALKPVHTPPSGASQDGGVRRFQSRAVPTVSSHRAALGILTGGICAPPGIRPGKSGG